MTAVRTRIITTRMRSIVRPSRTRITLLSVSGLTAPAVALAQSLPAEKVLLHQNDGMQVAKTWYVDEDGNFVLITQQQLVELAQAHSPGTPLQALSSAGPEGVTIPAGMFNQIIMYSAGIGGLAGGALVGGLMLATSGDATSNENTSGITVSSGSSGSSGSGQALNATVSVVDDGITRGDRGGQITYTLTDVDGIDESNLTASLSAAVGGASTIASIFPNGATVTTHDQSGLVSGTTDTYTSIGFTLTGEISEALNLGTFPGPEVQFLDAFGNVEGVMLQLTITEPPLPITVSGGTVGSTVSGSDLPDTITINTMVPQGTVDALGGNDTIILNDALNVGETIDGGVGVFDEITLNAAVTAGSVTNVETIDIAQGIMVDFDNFTGVTDVNISTTAQVTVDKLITSEVDTIAGASVVITDMASGNAADFDAAGNLTIESNDATLTDLTVEMNTGATLTLTEDAIDDAITDVTLTSAGDLTLDGARVADLKDFDASGVTGKMTVTATDFAALTTYEGAGGVDTIDVAGVTGTATITLAGGNDVFTSSATVGTLVIDGGAGTDSFTLAAGGNDFNIINVSTLSDLKVTAIPNAAAMTAAISAGAFEVVTNFTSGTDEFNMDNMGLSNISAVQTDMVSAYVQLTTNDVVILAENGVDYDGDTSTDDYFIIVDTAGDHSAVGIIKIDSATIVQSDIDIV